MRTVMTADQNPKGRILTVSGSGLRILSECCGSKIDDSRMISVIRKGEQVEEEWAMCSRCHRTLEENSTGWTSHPPMEHIEGTSPRAWKNWGKFWFGLDEFGMEVEW